MVPDSGELRIASQVTEGVSTQAGGRPVSRTQLFGSAPPGPPPSIAFETALPAVDMERWVVARYPDNASKILLSGWISGAAAPPASPGGKS